MFTASHILEGDLGKGVLKITFVLRFNHLHGEMAAGFDVFDEEDRAEPTRAYSSYFLEILKRIALHDIVADLAHLGIKCILVFHLLETLSRYKIHTEEYLHGRFCYLIGSNFHFFEISFPFEREPAETYLAARVQHHYIALLSRWYFNFELIRRELGYFVKEIILCVTQVERRIHE